MSGYKKLLKKSSIVAVILAAVIGLWILCGGDAVLLRFMAKQMPLPNTSGYCASKASPMLLDRNGDILYAFLAEDNQWRFPVTVDKISPLLIQATLATEDKRFYTHAGVDARAVLRAVWLNLKTRRFVSGASTLTMQLVKMHAPTPRTLPGKIQQAIMATRIDNVMTKDAILETYLNNAPYGSNLVGVEAASRRYFNKSCAELTLPEAALLAGIPKSPLSFDPLRYPAKALRRRNHVLHRMEAENMISPKAYRAALSKPLNAEWHDYPEHASHLAMTLRDTLAKQKRIVTTLDGKVQRQLEAALPLYLKQFDNQITNGAIMVVDAQNGEILARIASADFNNDFIHGQVDICTAPRAPGSTLKPFVYALAMEKNRLYPTEILLDNTLDFGVYNPGNFNGKFNGMVSAGEALRWSLNIPAIQIQERAGVEGTRDFLKSLGLDTLNRSAESYGLGLILGNCEVRLESLMEAYLTLARLGEHTPLRLTMNQPEATPRRVLSEGVSLAIWNMLEQPFPEEPLTAATSPGDRKTRVCWKTGTSTGYHDAWAIAFNRHYVVGVWVGNSNGRASNRLVGAHAALPLTAQVFRSLPVPHAPDWPQREDRLVEVEICAATGLPKSPWCPTVVTGWIPKNQYLNRRCDVHRPGKENAVIAHWPGSSCNWDLAAVPEAQSSTNNTQETGNTPPATSTIDIAASPAVIDQRKLDILAPANNATYILSGNSEGDKVRLNATVNSIPLHWYLNDHYLGRSEQLAPLYLNLTPGEHRIACMDDAGQTAAATFTVRAG